MISLLVNRRPQTPCLSAGAIEVRERIERRMHDLTRIAPYGNKFATYCGKLTGLFGRLCLVLHMIDPQWDTNDDFMADAVGLSTALTAELLMDFAYQNALTIYQTIESAGEGDRTMKSIARYIVSVWLAAYARS